MRGFQITSGCLVMKVRYLTRRSSGLYFYRRGVPEDLREFFGKRELVHSLKTYLEPEAVKEAQKYTRLYDIKFRELREGAERALAVAELAKFGMEDKALDRQSVYEGGIDPATEGSPYALLLEEYAAKADVGVGYDDSRLEGYERRAMEILHREEKFTLSDVKQRAIKRSSGKKKAVDELQRFFRYFSKGFLNGYLSDIRTRDVIAAVDALLVDLKTETVHKALGRIRREVREFMFEHDITHRNPFEGVVVPNRGSDAEQTYVFTYADLKKIKVDLETDHKAIAAQIAGLQFNTGCRVGEIGGLKVEDFFLDEDIPYFKIIASDERGLKNTNSERHIPLTGLSLEIATTLVEKASESEIYLFPR